MTDKKSRRMSLRIFHPRSSTPDITPAPSITSSPVETRHERSDGSASTGDGASPRTRPRVLNKTQRNSIFGSMRSLHSLEDDEKFLIKTESKSSSLQDNVDTPSPGRGMFGDKVKKAGEIQVTGTSMFRRNKSFVVLTESHLVRFKSQSKAAEMFPIIPHNGKSSLPRSSTMPAVSSFTDMQMSAYMDITQGVPLEEVIAVYKVEDGRPFFTIEVSYLDDRGKKSSSLQLSLNTPREAETWAAAIRDHATLRRTQRAQMYPQRTLEYLARALSKERDYDPLQFRVFKVVQRCPIRAASRPPAEDNPKSTVCYLVIGVNRVHLIPIPRVSGRSSSTSLSEVDAPSSFGITSLTSIKFSGRDDTFELYFRTPLRQPYVASLASYDAAQVALWLRYASEYLRPAWTVQPFVFDVPKGLEDQMDPPTFDLTSNDHSYFDRTLTAFCAAFDIDPSRIYYSVDYNCEDAPCFRLLPPVTGHSYSPMELLAVLRALRYDESFASISLANIDLTCLRTLYDPFSDSDDALCTRSGVMRDLAGHSELSVLQQEVRALSVKSRKLRRFDFAHCLPALKEGKMSSGIPEAITPLMKRSWTNVDFITLTGIQLSDHDIDYLVDAASERQCHLRALDVGESGLSVHDADVLLTTLGVHDNTMEVLDIAGTQGRFSPELFQRAIGAFSRIRRLNLTRVQKTAGPEPLIAPEILLSWRLEWLHLNGTNLNEQSVDTISTYLASPKSELLRELSVNQCGLSGKDLAIFFKSMTRSAGTARNMHISVSENRLGQGSSLLCKCIAEGCAPASITMRMVDFDKEYQFRELVAALAVNRTIKSLDISQASLPYDASMETCEALKDMFSRNGTLEELDISGDVAHLDVAKFGIGLNIALTGLAKNKALKLLRIEHQSLGMQGANTLAAVVEANRTLTEIHCEHNDINLQSFTVLVSALKKNTSLLFMPTQTADRAKSIEKIKEEFEALGKAEEPQSPRAGMLKKSFSAVAHVYPRHRRQSSTISQQSSQSFSQQDIHETIQALQEKWDTQTSLLQQYLHRNYQLSTGLTTQEIEAKIQQGHPSTADSLVDLISGVQFDPIDEKAGLGLTMGRASSPEEFNEKTPVTEKRAPIFTLPED